MTNRKFPLLAATTAVAVVATLAVACFSDRGASTVEPDASASCQVPNTPDVEGSTIVTIRGYAFHPATVHVRRGARVTWVNCESTSGLSHTSSADGQRWSSGLIAPATTFTETFDDVGTFGYHCDPHPFMTGTVVVE